MKKYNITTQKIYTMNGEEKKAYPQVGKLVKFDATDSKPESYIFEWNTQPDTKFYVFEDIPRDAQKQQTTKKSEDVIDFQDVPF